MKLVAELLPEERIMQPSCKPSIAFTSSTLPKSWGSELHRRFSRLYGPYFTDRFLEGPNQQREIDAWISIWTKSLSGLSGEQIKTGLERCAKERKHPPSSPAEFIELCKPSLKDLGLPDSSQSLNIVCGNWSRKFNQSLQERWVHPVVFHAARDPRIDLFNLRRMSTPQALKLWDPVYLEHCQRYASGEDYQFPEETGIEDRRGKAIAPEEKERARKNGLSHIRNLKKNLKG